MSEPRLGRGSGLRSLAAKGTIVNASFLVLVNALALVRGFLVAALLTPDDFGVWGFLVVILYTLQWFKQAGVGEKFVQQEEADQELEFQRAMTLQLALALSFAAIGALSLPVVAAVIDQPDIVAPGLVMLLVLPATALQAPLWIFYRRLDFVRQRKLQLAEPLVGFAIAVTLALAGLGYWSLVIAVVAGAWVGALNTLRASPYRFRWRWDHGALKRYTRFSTPLLVNGLTGVLVGNALVFIGEPEVGLAGVGIMTLAGTVMQFAGRADQAVTSALYPAICRVRDSRDLLFESFVKSNRLALMWGAPFGIGVALFAAALVRHGLGPEWSDGILLLQLTGVVAAVHQIGFNWDAFYRALDRTSPIAVSAMFGIAAFAAFPAPLLILYGLDGLAWGLLAAEFVNLLVRMTYLRRLFPDLRALRHILRALLPCLPAIVVVLGARASGAAGEGLADEIVLLGIYGALVVAATWTIERDLVSEVVGYLRRRTVTGAA